jgi:hypothetical protein
MTNTTTKKSKVVNYLSRGKGLTCAEARSRFGVQNLRAMMSDIRSRGFSVVTEETNSGNYRYYIRRG